MSGMSIAEANDWIEANQGLWGLLAVVLAIMFGIPALIQFALTVRDSQRSTDELHSALRTSLGRVSGPRLQNSAVGTRNILPMRLRRPDGGVEDAIDLGRTIVSGGGSVIILGEGGSGKSQLLQQLHLASYRDATSAGDPLIEVVSLGAFTGSGMRSAGIMDWAVRQIARRYHRSTRAIRALVAEAKLVVAFDALDEARPIVRAEIAGQLAALSRTHPIIVTSRSLPSDVDEGAGSLEKIVSEPRVLRLDMEPLAWTDVQSELDMSSLSGTAAITEFAASFTNPLHLQLLLFTAAHQPLTAEEIAEIARRPDSLLSRVVRGRRGPGVARDPALRVAALVSADQQKHQGVAFHLLPLQFGGVAFTTTTLIMLVGVALVGITYQIPVSATVIALGILACTPYQRQSVFGRLHLLLSSRLNDLADILLTIVLSFALVHLVRVVVWSISSGSIHVGGWQDLLDAYWLLPTVAFWTLYSVSPMGIDGALYSYGTYLRTHAWPQFAAFAVLAGGLAVWPSLANVGSITLAIYFATTSVYLVVSFAIAWLTSGVAPWKWHAALQTLVSRGVLSREGRLFKFTHASIEQHLLWALADDPRTPRLLWRVYGLHWTDRMFSGSIGAVALPASESARRVMRLLGSQYPWSPTVVNLLVCYYQWIAINPRAALKVAKRHVAYFPQAHDAPMLIDALDRLDVPRALALALARLRRLPRSVFEAHWLLRVVERHRSDAEMLELVTGLLEHRRLKNEDVIEYLAQIGLRYGKTAGEAVTDSSKSASSTSTQVASNALRHARLAQIARLRDDESTAKRESERSLDLIGAFDGYDSMLEVMLTSAAIVNDPRALEWTERAVSTGLRLRDQSSLEKRLAVDLDDSLDNVVA